MFVVSHNRRQGRRGSALVIALLLVMIGTFGITAWFSLTVARSMEVNAKEEGMVRRVTLNGVKEVARQIASQAFLADDDGTSSNTVVAIPSNGGSVDFAPWTATPYTASSNLRFDQIGGVPAQSFTTDLVAKLEDSGGPLDTLDYNVHLRTYVPALQGDLLTVHEPLVASTPITTDAGLLINGRTVVWDSTNALAHRTLRFHSSARDSTLSMLDLAGNPLLPDNEAFAPRSTGSDYIGRLKAHNASESAANRYSTKLAGLTHVILDGAVVVDPMQIPVTGYGSDGAGNVTIDLANPSLGHVHVTGNAHNFYLQGTASAATFTDMASYAPLLVVVENPAGNPFGALNIEFIGESDRAVVLMVRQDSLVATPVTFTARFLAGISFPRWRSILELEDSPAVFVNEAGISELQVRGGIRTDASIDTSAGVVRVLRDTQTPNVEALASRTGFVEIFRN